MPSRNVLKRYLPDTFYHLYNRGVEKRVIFVDYQDYSVFLNLLIRCLSEPTEPDKTFRFPISRVNLHEDMSLLAYILMPNHFHLLVSQQSKRSIEKLMRSIATSYSVYFNHKYNRVGALFQGTYKGVVIRTDAQLLHLSRYIHLNPMSLLKETPLQGVSLLEYPWSSYPYYMGTKQADWVKIDIILAYFKKLVSDDKSLLKYERYRAFVEGYDPRPNSVIKHLVLE